MSYCDREKKDHKVVISGIAGRFPKSDNVAEFQENLLNKIDCTTFDHSRWEYGTISLFLLDLIFVRKSIHKFDETRYVM